MLREDGFNYSFDPSACASCQGGCCTGESGYIYAKKREYESIAELLDITLEELKDNYLIKVKNRYSIKEVRYNDSYDCIFYDRERNGCKIYEARPLQCRTFPFWDYFKTHKDELAKECPGVKFDEAEDA